MEKRSYFVRRKFIAVRRGALALAVASAGYVAGALLHGTPSSSGASTGFAPSAAAAEPLVLSLTLDAVPSADAIDWGPPASDRIEQPRECDATVGISTACIFMD